jgi:rubredoxin
MSFENFDAPKDLPDDAKMECGVCWQVYDPAVGDDVWQIPPGTPFSALPDEWRCPCCDAPRSKFLRLGDDRSA